MPRSQRRQHSGINLSSYPACCSGGTDGGFSPLEPREGDYPIWLRLSGVTGATPFLLSRSKADGSLMPDRRGSPICPRSPSCHKPTSCAYLILDQSWICFTSDAPWAITELLPVTNVPPHVCHARGSRVSCCYGPAASDCYQP